MALKKLTYLIAGMFNSAGMERVTANKANYFASHGYEVCIVTTDQRGRADFYALHPAVSRIDLGINFDEYAQLPTYRKPMAFWRKEKELRQKLTQVLMQQRPDMTISLLLKSADFLYKIPDGSAKIMEHHFSKQYVSQFSDTFERGLIGRALYAIRGKIEAHYLRKYDRFVVLTQADARLWGKSFSHICVIPNSLSFVPKCTSNCTQPVVVAVGRLDYQKGFDRLIDIWARAQQPNWQLHIYGDGPAKQQLQQAISANGLTESVKLLPPTKNIESVLTSSSIFALTSRFEGFPMVLVEAMACGLPAVATDCLCGPSDIINDGHDGFLVPEDAPNMFAERLIALMQQPALRQQIGQQAAQNILRFSEENVMAQWTELFNQI